MLIERLMTKPVFTCRAYDSIEAAAQLMWDHDCGIIPVVDAQGVLVGVITDRDICMAALTQGRRLIDMRVEAAMARRVFAVRPEQPIADAEKLMADKQIRRLPVVDGENRPIGLLSLNDLARAADRPTPKNGLGKVLHTMAAVCRPRELPGTAGAP